jgi:hypothetical protein
VNDEHLSMHGSTPPGLFIAQTGGMGFKPNALGATLVVKRTDGQEGVYIWPKNQEHCSGADSLSFSPGEGGAPVFWRAG